MQTRRVFWLGCHKVLKRTELPLLRQLGYEVFNPSYLTPVYDQSADMRQDWDQPTTLPADIFAELMACNFFYTDLSPRIGEILNTYFDSAVVTINEGWLKSLLKVYKGPVVYRVYGQHFLLSEEIINKEVWPLIVERDNFTIVPFAEESIENEHAWFLDRCAPSVPYQIPDDVFAYTNCWGKLGSLRQEIATSIPNIQNPYFAEAYQRFNQSFPHRVFGIYGPQRQIPEDNRIIGGLPREILLDRFTTISGFLYNYANNVCYLPPIEVMQIGGPVIYRPGSLLARFYGEATPGLIHDELDAETKLSRLLAHDKTFLNELKDAQEPVRRRYDREHVIPAFNDAFRGLLGGIGPQKTDLSNLTAKRVSVSSRVAKTNAPVLDPHVKKIYVFMHVDGLFGYVRGKVYAFEGIPRVMDAMVQALLTYGDAYVFVTTTATSAPALTDFFRDRIAAGRLSLTIVSDTTKKSGYVDYSGRLSLIEQINAKSDEDTIAIIPHYYLFPECLLLKIPLMLYLPDYFPYLMPEAVFDVSREKDAENLAVGRAIAGKARSIFTNSAFTKGYLADADFVGSEETDKVIVAPLPLLGHNRVAPLADEQRRHVDSMLGGRPFVFYPTANRPNKQFKFLLRFFSRLRERYPNLLLVLTGSLDSSPGVAELADQLHIRPHLTLLSRIGEDTMQYLYENAEALVLTSTLEGNFPPQVLEALAFETPVVATRLRPILDRCGENGDKLLLCNPLDIDDFIQKMIIAIENRNEVITKQNALRDVLWASSPLEGFYTKLALALGISPSDGQDDHDLRRRASISHFVGVEQ